MIKKFKSYSRNKQLFITASTIVFLGAVIILAINAFFFHHRQYYFGTISELHDNQLIITTKFNNEREVLITPRTQIGHVKSNTTIPLTIGQRVMIISSKNEAGQREALTIRLFK